MLGNAVFVVLLLSCLTESTFLPDAYTERDDLGPALRGTRNCGGGTRPCDADTRSGYEDPTKFRYESQIRPRYLGAGLNLAASSDLKGGLKSCGGTHHEFMIFYPACCTKL